MGIIHDVTYISIFACFAITLGWDIVYLATDREVGGLRGIATRLFFLTFWNVVSFSSSKRVLIVVLKISNTLRFSKSLILALSLPESFKLS